MTDILLGIMSFLGVQFDDNTQTIALVNKLWLTPKKGEILWPPYKLQQQYDKALKDNELPKHDWTPYPVLRCHFELDDYEQALKKLKKWEETSDVQTASDTEEPQFLKRKRAIPKRFFNYSSDEDVEQVPNKLQRPPQIKFNKSTPILNKTLQTSCSAHSTPSRMLSSSRPHTPDSQNYCSQQLVSQPADFSKFDGTNDLPNGVSAAYQKKTTTHLLHLREQNDQILSWINKQTKTSQNISPLQALPPNLPVQFPLKNNEDVIIVEGYLENNDNLTALALYLSTLGGRDTTSQTNNILRYLMTNEVAGNYSFFGKRQQKKVFEELFLKTVVVRAVKTRSQVTEKDIENYIKVWLKHAPQRLKKEH